MRMGPLMTPEEIALSLRIAGYTRGAEEIEALTARIEELEAVCRAVLGFWASHEAFGDFASLTSAAGAFAPVADMARKALGED